MPFENFNSQVDLLLEVLPIITKHKQFALKGGTALNLFHLNLPRLSVDIDLCYLPNEERKTSLNEMHRILKEIKKNVETQLNCHVTPTKPLDGKSEARLIVNRSRTEIKIEPNYVIRGSLFPPTDYTTSEKVSEIFQKVATIQCLDINDLYGGKICAALDRQHPRDLFDMLKFFETRTIKTDVRDAFIYYLISHNRPFHEILAPNEKPIEKVFETEFSGMTTTPIALDQLVETRTKLKSKIILALDSQAQEFILSVAQGNPEWKAFRYPQIQHYPSVLWRLHNIKKMDRKKRQEQTKKLEKIFEIRIDS